MATTIQRPISVESTDEIRPSHDDVEFAGDLKIATCALVVCHVVAVFVLVPPSLLVSDTPILGADHPAHAYRVDVYRRALSKGDAPWGYDPRFGAGAVMCPTRDAGAKPQQFFGAVFSGVSADGVIKWFLFSTALTFPIWLWLAMRCLGLSSVDRVWGLAILLGGTWLYTNFRGFMQWGLAAYSFASFLLPLALACMLKYLKKPTAKWYAAAVASLSAVMCLHVLGPVLIGWTFVLAVARLPRMTARWRIATCLAPVLILALNSFWLIPFAMDFAETPQPPDREFAAYPKDLTYTSIEHLMTMLSPLRVGAAVIGAGGACVGWYIMKRRVGSLIATTWLVSGFLGVVLKFGGSFAPVVVQMQPSRFLLPAFVLLAVPAAVTAGALCQRLRVRQSIGVVLFSAALVLGTVLLPSSSSDGRTHINFAGRAEHEVPTFLSLPQTVPIADVFGELTSFIRTDTQDHERLLVQTKIQAETRMLALEWEREVVGNTYPDAFDASNFTLNKVLGKPFKQWSAVELRQALELWGIDWVMTGTDDAAELFQRTLNVDGIEVGGYRAFRVRGDGSRFVLGSGDVRASLNRIELSNLETHNGCCVLRYRYFPGFECGGSGVVFRYTAAGIPEGLIGIRTESRELTLKLDPWDLFTTQWPAGSNDCQKSPQ